MTTTTSATAAGGIIVECLTDDKARERVPARIIETPSRCHSSSLLTRWFTNRRRLSQTSSISEQ